ncbi:MAG: STAS domain-containing protein [SAR324 cluster bacterium]|nr:STAS domain-containing protein [SAR324 cluster bacterium]
MHITHRIQNDICIVSISGKITAGEELKVRTYIFGLMHIHKNKTVVIDFEKISEMNSIGIEAIMLVHKRFQQQRTKLAACQLNRHISRIFEITRLDRMIPVFHTQECALASLS